MHSKRTCYYFYLLFFAVYLWSMTISLLVWSWKHFETQVTNQRNPHEPPGPVPPGATGQARDDNINTFLQSWTVNRHGGERFFTSSHRKMERHVHIKKTRENTWVSRKYIVTNHTKKKRMTITPCASGYTERHSAWETVTTYCLFVIFFLCVLEFLLQWRTPHCQMHRRLPLLQNWADRRR